MSLREGLLKAMYLGKVAHKLPRHAACEDCIIPMLMRLACAHLVVCMPQGLVGPWSPQPVHGQCHVLPGSQSRVTPNICWRNPALTPHLWGVVQAEPARRRPAVHCWGQCTDKEDMLQAPHERTDFVFYPCIVLW